MGLRALWPMDDRVRSELPLKPRPSGNLEATISDRWVDKQDTSQNDMNEFISAAHAIPPKDLTCTAPKRRVGVSVWPVCQ